MSIAAITTVGYGEIIPRSLLGRLFTLPLLLFGLLLVALPSFVLGREFATLWEAMTRRGGVRLSFKLLELTNNSC
jgi:potassium voltage-gated channel Shal-related subfamily D protein 2